MTSNSPLCGIEQEPSGLPMKSTEEASIVHNMNMLEDSGNASIASKEEDEDLIGIPKADKTSSSRSTTDIEAESNKVNEDEAITDASKAMGGIDQEPSSLPMKFPEEANIVHNLNVLEVSKDEDKDLVGMPKADKTSSSRSITYNEAESNKVTEDEVIAGASKDMGENEESISTPDTEDIQISMEHGISPAKPEDTKDNSEFASDVEGDSKNLMGYETTIYLPEQGNLNSNLNIPIFVPGGEVILKSTFFYAPFRN